MKFRKKPVVIEAIQLQRRFDWPDWFHEAVTVNEIITHGLGKWGEGPVYCEIRTREGVMRADEGDWIIKEPFATEDRRFYPCKPDIFEMTYEPAE